MKQGYEITHRIGWVLWTKNDRWMIECPSRRAAEKERDRLIRRRVLRRRRSARAHQEERQS